MKRLIALMLFAILMLGCEENPTLTQFDEGDKVVQVRGGVSPEVGDAEMVVVEYLSGRNKYKCIWTDEENVEHVEYFSAFELRPAD